MQPAKLNYKIYQGSTFQQSYRWESETKVYVPISAVYKSAPCVVTTTQSHNLPLGWRFRVVGAGGMKEINSVGEDSYYVSTPVTIVPPVLIDEQELEDIYTSVLYEWQDIRAADAQQVAPVIRPWADLSPQDTYELIMSAGEQVSPPVPNIFAPKLNSVNTAYQNWQTAITTNQATLAAAQDAHANKIEINQINSLGYNAYTSGGIIEYNSPVPLSGYAVRMQIRETVDSPTVLYSATGGTVLTIDQILNTINIDIPASVTQSFDFTTAVYSIELYTPNGLVVPFIAGNLTLVPEVTR